MKKVILWLLVMTVVIGLIYVFVSGGKNPQSNKASSWLSGSSSVSPILTGGIITVDGWSFCLKHKGTGSECVIGIEDQKGNDYALLDYNGQPVDPTKYTTGQRSTVFGDLVQDSALQAKYDIVGAIQLKQ